MLINEKISSLIKKLLLTYPDIFKPEDEIVKDIVRKNSSHQLSLENEKHQIKELYEQIKNAVKTVDETLTKHVDALQAKLLKNLDSLEKKLLKAERRKFEAEQGQIKKIRSGLFPNNSLQERVENFMPFYAKWGKEFLDVIYDNSLIFEQEFCIIKKHELQRL
jgi:uncharacterized protein YllA (UPF0747 family)